MNCTRTLVIFLLLTSSLVVSPAKAAAECYDPANDPRVNQIYGRDFIASLQPAFREAYERSGIDPRLVYHRMVGEAGGACPATGRRADPECTNSVGAYGLFQFKGNFYKKPPHRSQIQARYRGNDINDHRRVQILYYLNDYVPQFAGSLPNGTCRDRWSSMSALSKVTALGWGSCSTQALNKEMALMTGKSAGGSYDPGIIGSVPGIGRTLHRQELPLCPGWGASPSRGRSSRRGSAAS